MRYDCLNEVRLRMNRIGVKLNEATSYGRKKLPSEFEDLNREWHELCEIYMKPALLARGVEIRRCDDEI